MLRNPSFNTFRVVLVVGRLCCIILLLRLSHLKVMVNYMYWDYTFFVEFGRLFRISNNKSLHVANFSDTRWLLLLLSSLLLIVMVVVAHGRGVYYLLCMRRPACLLVCFFTNSGVA